MRRGYSIVATLSFLLRLLFIQNYWPIIIPMTFVFGTTATKVDVSYFLAEGILWAMSFAMTGLFYERRSFPALGSILYLVFYIANSFTLSQMSSTGWAWYSFVLAGLIYFLVLYGFVKFKSKFFGFE